MRERWFEGLWLGIQSTAAEHILATHDGREVRARAVHPRPDTVRLTKEGLLNIKVGPWAPTEVITQGIASTPPRREEECQPTQEERPAPWGVRITGELIERFSHTKGCPICEAMKRGGRATDSSS